MSEETGMNVLVGEFGPYETCIQNVRIYYCGVIVSYPQPETARVRITHCFDRPMREEQEYALAQLAMPAPWFFYRNLAFWGIAPEVPPVGTEMSHRQDFYPADSPHATGLVLYQYPSAQHEKITLYTSENGMNLGSFPKERAHLMHADMELFLHGLVRCSDCHFPSTSVWRFFAGGYCWSCWIGKTGKNKDKGGWRQIERAEKYT